MNAFRIRNFLSFLALLTLCLVPQSQGNPQPRTPASGRLRIDEAYGKLPLYFEVNQGQTDPRVKFLSRGPGYTLFLTPSEAVLALRKSASQPILPDRFGHSERSLGFDPAPHSREPAPAKDNGVVLRMKLVGANSHARVIALEELAGKANYFIGNDPKKWRTNVPTYAKVKVQSVYRGVDLVYYGKQRQLEHDFIVAAGTDPGSITIGFAGAEKLSLDAEGDLVIAMKEGEVRLQKPIAYQEVDGVRRGISGSYVLKGAREVGFRVGAYDSRKLLIIDPVLFYSTYLGGSGSDTGFGIAVDSAGNAYVTGATLSTNFPTTAGAFQPTFGGGFPAFVTKFNPTGSALIYSTYLGGTNGYNGAGRAIAVDDPSGDAYVAGFSSATDFPTTPGAFQTSLRGVRNNVFITKLNPAGSALVYSTYFGGSSGSEVAVAIALDSSLDAFVTG